MSELDRRIRIVAFEDPVDSDIYGDPLTDPVPRFDAEVWARLEHSEVKPQYASGKLADSEHVARTYKIRYAAPLTHHFPDIRQSVALFTDDRRWVVQGIREDTEQRRRYMFVDVGEPN